MSSIGQEQQFSIQPHPATTNDPNNDPALNNSGERTAAMAAHEAKPGPHVPDAQTASSLEQPKSREELAARSAELNK